VSRRRARRNPPSLAGGLVLACCVALAGCSGNGAATVPFKRGGPPPPPSCIERYNGDETALSFGKHAYSLRHGSRAARVFTVFKPAHGGLWCVVVYADVESDREFGTLGQFGVGNQWTPLTEYPVRSEKERLDLQRTGAERANSKLNEDGTLTAF
jgi:hypothetical protein